MAIAYLGLGANIGDPQAQLCEALEHLEATPGITVTKKSAMIATKPWGKTDQPDFQNMVIEIETGLSPEALLDACLKIEAELGRVRREKWGPRLIDIDIVAYGRQVSKSERLTLPHPFAHERDFVLDPLREIAPDMADWIVEQASSR